MSANLQPSLMDTSQLDLEVMRTHATAAVTLLKVIANEDRLLLICQIAQQERTVSELEQLTGIRQPTLSQQLGVLRRENLVSTRREGKHIWYHLTDTDTLALIEVIQAIFCSKLNLGGPAPPS
ncbi:MAG: metalloregulator ArsR/SmtB family transcription factor [Pigmentiphaga sp.]